jgi:CRP-like cAMP-binding protein
VLKGEVVVNTIDHPGSVIGEMSLLLGARHSATVEAIRPTRVRFAANGNALLDGDPTFARFVATGLAERLAYVTTYLADLTVQYGDAPGLSMVATVLSQLERRTAPKAVSGSVRDPDPDY